MFARLVLKLAPQPDVAYVIDADPVAAQARKPEYPVDFVRRNRNAYLTLAHFSGRITVVGPDSIAAMKTRIRSEMLQLLAHTNPATVEHSTIGAPKRANISSGELIEP
jgi:hypothetical protein